ncbi:MAG: hypothetical protein ACYDCB_05070, partial [Candidatus Dormibacteria bacterium]
MTAVLHAESAPEAPWEMWMQSGDKPQPSDRMICSSSGRLVGAPDVFLIEILIGRPSREPRECW